MTLSNDFGDFCTDSIKSGLINFCDALLPTTFASN